MIRQAREDEVGQLAELYESCMRAYSEAFYPWDPHLFTNSFSTTEVEVVEYKGRIAGLLRTEVREDYVYLAELQLDQPFRKQGVGTALVKLTIERAAALGLPVRLRVLRNNPARRLYERLGFRQIAKGAIDYTMQRELNKS